MREGVAETLIDQKERITDQETAEDMVSVANSSNRMAAAKTATGTVPAETLPSAGELIPAAAAAAVEAEAARAAAVAVAEMKSNHSSVGKPTGPAAKIPRTV